ncbi:acyltransferase domain-containing protein [Streptomyces sp. NPDC059247]|uniref:acyltransferase domain-containing protein n=1 Tax=Streptomyces sp. NPDC059247 TaxID=3346790 RepID=UPI00369B9FCA
MARTVHMFPGQGDFPVREFTAALARDEVLRAAAEATFAAVDRDHTRRGVPALRPWLLGRTPPDARELAEAPVGTGQLALFGASMSVHTALVHRYGRPDAVLGVSFGEIAALTAAGALTVREGAGLAHVLARVLATAPGGLTLLVCDEATAAVLIAPVDTGALAVACVNHPEETVVAGPLRELARLEARATAAGIGAVRLRLPFSAHHPALTAQADRFHAAVRARLPRRPLLPVLSAVAGRAYRPGEDLPRRLADCLVRPAHLPAVLRLARATGHDTFREAGPGTTLTRAARRVLPEDLTVSGGLGEAPEPEPGTAPGPGPGSGLGPGPGSGLGSGAGPGSGSGPGGSSGEGVFALGLPGDGPVDGPAPGGPSGIRPPPPLVRPVRAATPLPLLPE